MNYFIQKFAAKNLNNLIARMMIGRFLVSDLKDEKLKSAIWFWLDNL